MSEGRQTFVSRPAESVGGELTVPGDKSISHRALLLSAIATGNSTIRGFLESEDCLATRGALQAMGVEMLDEGTDLRVRGVGREGLRSPSMPLDLGNSGTGIRLLAGVLAAQSFDSVLTGDESLRTRPMERVATPLRAMGAAIKTREGRAPLTISGGRALTGIDYTLPVASAQLKSALLLAGIWAKGRTIVRSPGPSRDHTERMLEGMGVPLDQGPDHVVSLTGTARLEARDLEIPGDFSSASFFLVSGLLGARDGLLIRNVGVNPTRTGLLTILQEMGGRIELRNRRDCCAEPVADLFVVQSELNGIEVAPDLVPLAIDEFPVLFIAAACARGRTVVTGAGELRHKESDRLRVMAEGLRALGASVVESPDGLSIDGGALHGGRIDSHRDHRVAMAFAIAGQVADDAIEILRTDEVATSFPEFLSTAARSGLAIQAGGGAPGDD